VSVAIDELRKRTEQYYSRSYEIDHSDEYERDRLGHLAEGIEEAIDYIVAARNMDSGSVADARVRVVIGALETAADAAGLDLRDDVLVGIDQLRVVLAAAQRSECRSVDRDKIDEISIILDDAIGAGDWSQAVHARDLLDGLLRATEQESKPPSDEP